MSERQDKQAQFAPKKNGKLPWVVVFAALVAVLGVTGWKFFAAPGGKYPLVAAAEGRIAIPLERVSDGRAHFFTFRDGQTLIDFFVLRSSDGVIRAALDTCDVCYHARKGYRQEGDFMICNNCNMRFRSERIGDEQGGCNPAPLQRTIADGKLIIAEAELKAGARYFR